MGLIKSIKRRWKLANAPRHEREYIAEYRRWLKDDGEAKRYHFPGLPKDAVIIDLGGYEGEWATGIAGKYNPTIHVFEPHPGFSTNLEKLFEGNARITVHPVALASKNDTFFLSDEGNASRSIQQDNGVTARSVESKAYLAELGISHVDLMKVNIEGGEYDILPHLVETNFIQNIDILQVQFHRFSDDDEARRSAIVSALAQTHSRTWCYPFIWEEWRLTTSR